MIGTLNGHLKARSHGATMIAIEANDMLHCTLSGCSHIVIASAIFYRNKWVV